MKKVISKEDKSKIDLAAEQLSRIFIEQIKWKKIKDNNSGQKRKRMT